MADRPTETPADPDQQLGNAIRRLRKKRGLTLVQLAGSAGLSHPFLSQLERGLTRPSMPSLHRIAQALGTTQQALLAHSATSPADIHVVREGTGTPVANSGGSARMLGAPQFAVHPVEYTGGPTAFEEYYDHPGDEFLYVVHGAIEVDLMGPDGRELHRLHAGDSLLYPGGTSHRWRVLTEEQDPSGVHVLTVQNAPR
ncbi:MULTISPECIES: helix-turn-helix domain-containing protein [unclassified Streptomyces]|uniref:helix-turn-helix domain-containing protein n=1 Tax=unclassified Streptomyces TaxID=2593676 RepID=UPI00225BFBE2|nr:MULTISPECIES: XRE family transcriptional regulator [unclassified Streptomyces]MCX5327976.1 XRE family transcriptional regulator [Streptomyces sp. NBC_00140]MCX5357466.1 XRE family transcriptional regulator [Streptomyces sp. NBC_00124]